RAHSRQQLEQRNQEADQHVVGTSQGVDLEPRLVIGDGAGSEPGPAASRCRPRLLSISCPAPLQFPNATTLTPTTMLGRHLAAGRKQFSDCSRAARWLLAGLAGATPIGLHAQSPPVRVTYGASAGSVSESGVYVAPADTG